MFLNERERRVAVVPAILRDETLSSHADWTCGGIVTDTQMKTPLMLEAFDVLEVHLRAERNGRLIYTPGSSPFRVGKRNAKSGSDRVIGQGTLVQISGESG